MVRRWVLIWSCFASVCEIMFIWLPSSNKIWMGLWLMYACAMLSGARCSDGYCVVLT